MDGRNAKHCGLERSEVDVRIKLEVFCDGCKGLIGTYYDNITEKYPFNCDECDDIRMYKWPWYILASIEEN